VFYDGRMPPRGRGRGGYGMGMGADGGLRASKMGRTEDPGTMQVEVSPRSQGTKRRVGPRRWSI